MPQLLLPIFPDAVTPIKDLLSVGKQVGQEERAECARQRCPNGGQGVMALR